MGVFCIGVARFELTTFCSQSRRSTRLSYTPQWPNIAKNGCFYNKKTVFGFKSGPFLGEYTEKFTLSVKE